MMVLVDTTVWIDFLTDKPQPHVTVLTEFIRDEEDLCLCGVILTEVLQGIRSNKDYLRTREYLNDLLFLPMSHATFIRAAELFRDLRKKGVTIRNPIDCMIASVALENDICLLHNDRDFVNIANHSALKLCT